MEDFRRCLNETIAHAFHYPTGPAIENPYDRLLDSMWAVQYDRAFEWAEEQRKEIVEKGVPVEYGDERGYLLKELIEDGPYKKEKTVVLREHEYTVQFTDRYTLDTPATMKRTGDTLIIDYNSNFVYSVPPPKEFPIMTYRNRICEFTAGPYVSGHFNDFAIQMDIATNTPGNKYVLRVDKNSRFSFGVYNNGLLANVYSNCALEKDDIAF